MLELVAVAGLPRSSRFRASHQLQDRILGHHSTSPALLYWMGRHGSQAPTASLLSWLLHDPTAPPRQFIKHIIVRRTGRFTAVDLDWHGPRKTSQSVEWKVEQLTVQHDEDAPYLYSAGMRPQTTFLIGCLSRRTNILPSEKPTDKIHNLIGWGSNGTHWHTWARSSENSDIGEDGNIIMRGLRTMQHRTIREQLDPRTMSVVLSQDAGQVLTIQLEDGDLFHDHQDVLLKGIAAALARDRVQVVLACTTDDRIAGQKVEDFIRGAVPTRLPRKAVVEGRLRVSYMAWAPMLVEDDSFDALAQSQRCGRDPWDMGHAIEFEP